MSAVLAQECTKCGESKPMEAYGIRRDRGQPYRQCRDCMAERKWGKKNPERLRALRLDWEDRNPDRLRAIWRDMAARKRQSPAYRVQGRVQCGIYACLGGQKKRSRTFDLLGYTLQELQVHLERQFLKGMSWENMGQWHIDHIIPLASFTITGPDDPELRRAWALPNLRPLWAADNIAKKDKRTSLL